MAHVNPFESFGSHSIVNGLRRLFTYGKRREAEGYAKGYAEANAEFAPRGDNDSEGDDGA